jgi:hypothetical protein
MLTAAPASGAPVSASVTRPLNVNVTTGSGVGDTGSGPPQANAVRHSAMIALLASMS